jgi:hypothetical protein
MDFKIYDETFTSNLQLQIKKYYIDKAKDEVLDCYQYDITQNKINAHDFIVGFQNLCNAKYHFIEKTNADGLSLYFKIYKSSYGGLTNTFTSENVNDFIEKINYSCEVFQKVLSNIFTDKINNKLFNSTCEKKLHTLKKNNIYIIICCIIGFINKGILDSIIICEVEKCLLYHFMSSDVKDKDSRADFKINDSIIHEAGGSYIDAVSKKMLSHPEHISNKITDDVFIKLIKHLYSEQNQPYERLLDNGKNKNDKRRQLKFYEKTLMFYYYKVHMPINQLNNEFSIEHICPNSSVWEGELDKDRIGNLMPILERMNNGRGNRDINYYDNEDYREFCIFIKDIKPTSSEYDEIISHDKKKPFIKNNEKYNDLCDRNEDTYTQNFIKCIFK